MTGDLLTVAFVDVERSTELLTTLGDTEGVAAIDGVLNVVRERIGPYGGREVKALGDGLMIVFRTPRQAVVFAVAVQAAMGSRVPRVRVGVNTGEVDGDAADPVGEAVNAAARIVAKAGGGEVLVSDVVRQLAGTTPGVRFVDRGRSQLKGFPVRWRLFGVVGVNAAPEAAPVFGRAEELAAIEWLLAGIVEGKGRALVLEGEAGIGKTHLVGSARFRARVAGVGVLEGGADELERDRPGRILGDVARGLGISLVANISNGGDGEGGSRGFAVVEALVDAVEDAAAARPVLIIAEDLHWADELSLRGIAALGRRLAPLPVGLLLTMRPTPTPALLAGVLASIGDQATRHIRLERLDESAVGALVASVTGAAPGATLASRLRGTAGNPLYVLELIRALDEDGGLRVESGAVELDDGPLPSTLRATIVRRLSGLQVEAAEVLRLASLLGGDFTLRDLAVVASRRVVDVAACLHESVESGILAGEGDTLSFRHDLIREAVYDDIAPAIRRDLHAAAGRALARAGAPTQQVARQLTLGARPGDLLAVEWLERAGHEVLSLDPSTSVTLFEEALDLAPEGWPGRAAVEAALLEPLAASGRVDEARAVAARLLDRLISPADELATRRGLATALAVAGDLRAAAQENEAAAALSATSSREARVLRCLSANMSILTGRFPDDVRADAERALDEARECPDELLAALAHQALGLAAIAQAKYDDALHHARISRRLQDQHRLPSHGFLIPRLWEASCLLCLDRFDESLEVCTAEARRAEREGQISLLVQTHFSIAGIHLLAGRAEEAASAVEAGLTVANETGAHAQTVGYHAVLARLALMRGDQGAAEAHLLAGQQTLAAGGHLFGVDLLLWAQAAWLEAGGDVAAARLVLEMAWAETETIHFLLQWRNLGPELVRLARADGDVDRARAIASELEAAAGRSTSPSASAAAVRARGLAEDDPDLLVDAATRYRQTPRKLELAAVCEEAARSLFGRGRGADAAGLLEEAAAVAADAGGDGDLARLDALMRAHGVRRHHRKPARATHGWDSLSPSEEKVVELVAEGMSNPQISARLYVSRRTIETHVSHVFRKLDLSSRTQLAAMAVARRAARSAPTNPAR